MFNKKGIELILSMIISVILLIISLGVVISIIAALFGGFVSAEEKAITSGYNLVDNIEALNKLPSFTGTACEDFRISFSDHYYAAIPRGGDTVYINKLADDYKDTLSTPEYSGLGFYVDDLMKSELKDTSPDGIETVIYKNVKSLKYFTIGQQKDGDNPKVCCDSVSDPDFSECQTHCGDGVLLGAGIKDGTIYDKRVSGTYCACRTNLLGQIVNNNDVLLFKKTHLSVSCLGILNSIPGLLGAK